MEYRKLLERNRIFLSLRTIFTGSASIERMAFNVIWFLFSQGSSYRTNGRRNFRGRGLILLKTETSNVLFKRQKWLEDDHTPYHAYYYDHCLSRHYYYSYCDYLRLWLFATVIVTTCDCDCLLLLFTATSCNLDYDYLRLRLGILATVTNYDSNYLWLWQRSAATIYDCDYLQLRVRLLVITTATTATILLLVSNYIKRV